MLRKPSVAARRVTLFEREIRFTLSHAAVELLFETAEILSEGEPRGGGYFGSTMITFDLSRLAPAVREPCDAASARQVAALLLGDPRIRDRARRVAADDAGERAGAPLARVDAEIRAHATGTRVHLDLDVEAELAHARQAP